MKIFKKIAVMMMAMMLMVGVGIIAGKPTDVYASQSVTDEATEHLGITYIDDAGIFRHLTFDVKCAYTAVWDEGYGGHIASATFYEATNEYVGGTPVSMSKKGDESVTVGDSRCMVYYVGSIYVKVTISVDEWGDVSLWATRITKASADELFPPS